MSSDDQIVARWTRWLERLSREVLQLHHNRRLFTGLRDAIIDEAPDTSATWPRHYGHIYAHSQAIAVRRVTKGSRGSISLCRLIGEMKNNTAVLTRARHVALYKDSGDRRLADKRFEEDWGDGSGQVSAQKLHGRLSRLMQDLTTALGWADNVAAHIAEDGPEPSMTFADLHAAIDRVGEAFNDLSILLTASEWVKLTPSIAADWKAPFRRPLFEPLGEER